MSTAQTTCWRFQSAAALRYEVATVHRQRELQTTLLTRTVRGQLLRRAAPEVFQNAENVSYGPDVRLYLCNERHAVRFTSERCLCVRVTVATILLAAFSYA